MSNILSVKTNFTSGQVSTNLYGRGDLSIYENGARSLENVIIHPTGGVSRRKGLKYVDTLPSKCKMIPFEFNTEQTYLLCLYHKNVRIYKDDVCIKTLPSPWEEEHLAKLNWTQSADTLLIVHPDVQPQQISRSKNEVWSIDAWEFYSKDGNVFAPYFNFYQRKESITPSGASGNIILTSDNPIFSADYVGTRIKMYNGEIAITEFISATQVKGNVAKALNSVAATKDWQELSFSKLRGWPTSVTFHQDRMVIGGSKSLPNRLWLSKSSDLFNFDLGKGLDDEAIEFAILSDQVNAIQDIVSTRHLLVFTAGAEWMVSGEPLAPTSIRLNLQTKVGSYGKYSIQPQNIDGATIFVSASGKQLREFLYTDVEQAYLAKDLTLLSNDIINQPVCSAYNQDESILYLVLEDGTISCLTSYRTEEVNAWSKLKTKGNFLSSCILGNDVYFGVQRTNGFFIEKFCDDCYVDNSCRYTSATPKKNWKELNLYNDCEVAIIADGFNIGKIKVIDNQINLIEAASEITIGLPYEHVIEPLPLMVDAIKPIAPKAFRVIQSIFRIINSKAFQVDIGNGYFEVPLKKMYKDKILDSPPLSYSGDIELRSLGWIREMNKPTWSIRSDVAYPFVLLSVINEIKIKE